MTHQKITSWGITVVLKSSPQKLVLFPRFIARAYWFNYLILPVAQPGLILNPLSLPTMMGKKSSIWAFGLKHVDSLLAMLLEEQVKLKLGHSFSNWNHKGPYFVQHVFKLYTLFQSEKFPSLLMTLLFTRYKQIWTWYLTIRYIGGKQWVVCFKIGRRSLTVFILVRTFSLTTLEWLE